MLQVLPNDLLMNLARQGFNKLIDKSNKTWSWSANLVQIIFPFEYNFGAAFEEVFIFFNKFFRLLIQ